MPTKESRPLRTFGASLFKGHEEVKRGNQPRLLREEHCKERENHPQRGRCLVLQFLRGRQQSQRHKKSTSQEERANCPGVRCLWIKERRAGKRNMRQMLAPSLSTRRFFVDQLTHLGALVSVSCEALR